MYWKSPISILGKWGYEIQIFLSKMVDVQTVKTLIKVAFYGVWSGSAVFAKDPFRSLPTTMD